VQATIERAQAEYGEDIVLRAGLAVTNDASRATASKWAREFFEPLDATIVRVRRRPPSPMQGVTVRAARPEDYTQIVERQNAYFADYNLYSPLSEASLQQILQHAPSGEPIYQYWIAEDAGAKFLAGVLLRQRGLLMIEKINHLPLPLRLLNMFAHMIPPDHIMRGIGVEAFWFAADQRALGHYFIETLRWQMRDKGSTFTFAFDPRNPIALLLQAKSPFQPRFQIAYALRGPVKMNPERLVAAGTAR
jgi:hypothetical protein